jgi:hypothetical protein
MFSNQDSQGSSLFSAPVDAGCKDTISSNTPAWQDIVLIFLRLYFAFGTPSAESFNLGTADPLSEDFFATFAISSLEWRHVRNTPAKRGDRLHQRLR